MLGLWGSLAACGEEDVRAGGLTPQAAALVEAREELAEARRELAEAREALDTQRRQMRTTVEALRELVPAVEETAAKVEATPSLSGEVAAVSGQRLVVRDVRGIEHPLVLAPGAELSREGERLPASALTPGQKVRAEYDPSREPWRVARLEVVAEARTPRDW